MAAAAVAAEQSRLHSEELVDSVPLVPGVAEGVVRVLSICCSPAETLFATFRTFDRRGSDSINSSASFAKIEKLFFLNKDLKAKLSLWIIEIILFV